jgi:hypothetical protein
MAEKTEALKTSEQVEALKRNWLNDPVWDIEDTPGFEAHRDELAAFHQQMRAEWGKPPAWTAARSVALAILGKLAVDGLLADHIQAELNYAVDAIAEVITDSLAAMPGGCDGDFDKVLEYAAIGEQFGRKGGAE